MYNAGNFNEQSGKTIELPSLKRSLSYDKSNVPNPNPTAPIVNANTKKTVKTLIDRQKNKRNWDAKVAILPYGATDIATQGNIKYPNTGTKSLLKTR